MNDCYRPTPVYERNYLNDWKWFRSSRSGNRVGCPVSARSGRSVDRISIKEGFDPFALAIIATVEDPAVIIKILRPSRLAHQSTTPFTALGILFIRNSLNPDQQPLQSGLVLIRLSSLAFAFENSSMWQNLCTHWGLSSHKGPKILILSRD